MARQSKTLARKARITAIVALAATMFAGRSVTADDTAAKSSMERARFLLLDSRIIESTKNEELTVGTVLKDKNNPLFKEDKAWDAQRVS